MRYLLLRFFPAGATTASQAAAAATAPDASSIPGEPAAATAAAAAAGVQWADKHEPSSVEGLLVHTRKVAELQAWLQVYLEARQAGYCPTRVLLVTGARLHLAGTELAGNLQLLRQFCRGQQCSSSLAG